MTAAIARVRAGVCAPTARRHIQDFSDRFFLRYVAALGAAANTSLSVESRGYPVKAWRETRVTSSFKRFIRHVKLFAKSHVSRRVKTRLLQERVVLLLLLLLLLGAARLRRLRSAQASSAELIIFQLALQALLAPRIALARGQMAGEERRQL